MRRRGLAAARARRALRPRGESLLDGLPSPHYSFTPGVKTRGGSLRFRFKSKKLEALYTKEKGAKAYPRAVVDGFFHVMTVIADAADERDLRAMKSLHFEKLRGDRAGQSSLRLDKQFRLIVSMERDSDGAIVVVISIEDYHR